MTSGAKNATSLRIAFHAINGVGLGHLLRLVSLAREMRALLPSARFLFLTNARDPQVLVDHNFDFVQFPLRVDEPHVDPERCLSGLPENLDSAAQQGALRAFEPHLVVFDTHPSWPLVEAARALGARTALVLRELRPEAFRRFLGRFAPWAFDQIVIPQEPEDVDRQALPEGLAAQICGPVLRDLSGELPTALERRLRGAEPLLLACAGGGGQPVDAARFLSAVQEAHQQLRESFPSLKTVLVRGPNAQPAFQRSSAPGLVCLAWTAALPALLRRAEVVVSQAGYNAICEIRALRKPAVLVPGYRRMEDQSARARRLVSLGAARLAAPRADSILKRVHELLASPSLRLRRSQAHERHPLIPGNREAARTLLRPVTLLSTNVSRVVLVAPDFPPKIGGMETAARSLAEALSRQGVEVIVYTSVGFGRPTGLSTLPQGFPPSAPPLRVRSLYLPLRGPRSIDLLGDLLLTLQALQVDAPDVVHLTHAGLAPWIPALRATFPCVITSHIHGNDLLAPWVESGTEASIYRSALVEGLNRSDGVAAVSRFSQNLAVAAGVRLRKTCVVFNGVDALRFAPGPIDTSLGDRLGILPTDEVVLTVSRLAARKGHNALLAALPSILAQCPKALFAFTGGSESQRSEFLSHARDLGVETRVRALGWVSEEDLPALFRLAKVFVLAPDRETDTDVEGLGIALLEAAASGLPTVSSRTGGVPEAVVEGETGLAVPPGDSEALGRAVVQLLLAPTEAKRLGEAGRQRVLRLHSWDQSATALLKLWNRSLRQPRTVKPQSDLQLQALVTGKACCGIPSVLTTRRQLSSIATAAELAYLARKRAFAAHAEEEKRREKYLRWVQRGRTVRFKATGALGQRFSEALNDCRALGYRPDAEIKLRAFLDPAFQTQLRPLLRNVLLLHGLPCSNATETIEQVSRLTPEAISAIRSLRLYLTPEALRDPIAVFDAVSQAQEFRRAFQQEGITVVPPPELMRHLSLTPSPGPETAMVEPCNRCNLSCPTCPTGLGKIPPLPDMTEERFSQVLTSLGPQVRTLALWNYGEPALNSDLDKLIARAKAQGVASVKVSSNGLLLRGDRARALLLSGLDVLILSVDGASQQTYEKFRLRGSFSLVSEAIQGLCSEKRRLGLSRPSIELQFIVMRHNEHELDSIRALAREWGVDRLRLKTFGATDEQSRTFIPQSLELSRYERDGTTPKTVRRFCPLPWDHVVVSVDGAVTPCCYLRPDRDQAFVMGNLFETPFPEIWRGSKYRAFRAAMLNNRDQMPVCRSCHGNVFELNASVEELS